MSVGVSWSRNLLKRLTSSGGRFGGGKNNNCVPAIIGASNEGSGMFPGGTHGLRKYFSCDGGLLSPTGGVALSASFFKSQHLRLVHHEANNGDTCTRQMSTTSSSSSFGGGGQEIEQDLKLKLEELKQRLASNAYYEKYKDKFAQMEMTSPKELLAKLEQLGSQSAKPKSSVDSKDAPKPKAFCLGEVMSVGMLKDLSRDEVIHLWQDFHRLKDGVLAAVMSGAVFEQMEKLAMSYSIFVMPLPRTDGYEFFLVQYMDKVFHFTPLLVYQTHKENAPEVLRLINYTDLKDSKDLVLMRGEFDTKIMSIRDAHILAVQTNFFYGEISDSRKKLLDTFTSTPNSFDHMKLIDEFKILQESYPHLFEFENLSPSSSPSSSPTPA